MRQRGRLCGNEQKRRSDVDVDVEDFENDPPIGSLLPGKLEKQEKESGKWEKVGGGD